ncbi:polyhydroxyalkanoate synthase [Novosphingobium sp. SG751A]|uniref:PHA/PHB synthase family protein n=1 Tax=Novosphingobium sp. SG751A TaxID=2587000 RepID=UPI0020A64799|nr:alpha/beta fold hydrolase [Novosphingobium sp. SG751A]NOW45081.1 polyhydroxyalkanoate synthase [Novosphingobium sp. SG751A]
MSSTTDGIEGAATKAPSLDPLSSLMMLPFEVASQTMDQWLNPKIALPDVLEQAGAIIDAGAAGGAPLGNGEDAAQWADVAGRMQAKWMEFQTQQAGKAMSGLLSGDLFKAELNGLASLSPAMNEMLAQWGRQIPLVRPETQQKLLSDGMKLWEGVLAQWGLHAGKGEAQTAALPRSDRRFADAAWRETPYFALVHQTYLLMAEQITAMADSVEGLDEPRKEQLRFYTRTMIEALSPDHFALTNPLVMEKAIETRGESLVKGLEHLLEDVKRGQLSHTNRDAFKVGENIAATPGKVVHRTPFYELIQYSPSTEQVMATPLLIFPPWINRFYILDLNAKKSFVKWAVDQGITVFLVSWKSADPQDPDMDWGAVTWDDYIGAQIEAIDVVRERLKVPSVHTIGYCVAGTTLAATLAVLARRGEAEKVASATFFTAQVDFEKAGELKTFIDDQQLAAIGALAQNGVIDGRYLAATFNLLRSQDLIWSYVTRNYLLGEDYSAFDLLFWNGDSTNLPAGWHQSYLRDLYRDNLLVQPDALSGCGTPIDLSRITTPAYIQAGREDHIAPPESVWRLSGQLKNSPHVFVLAGSGHIAGVVNPPAAKKYQFWTNDEQAENLAAFVAQAKETPGSWWNHWLGWLQERAPEEVAAKGKRVPGGRGDKVLADAPGDYVRAR